MILNQSDLGPVNIKSGDLALFVAEFFDDQNLTTVPDFARLSITYVNLSAAEQTDTLVMALNNSYYTTVWSSSNAAPGLALWMVSSDSNSSAAQLGIIRVVNE